MHNLGIVVSFLLGISIGSFINVVIYRLAKKKSPFKGRSFCPNCKHKLIWKDLFPILSFIVLKRRCRYCKKKISYIYPTVEIITGILFVLAFLKVGINNTELVRLFYFWFVITILIIVFIYDLKYYIILDRVILPATIIIFFINVFILNSSILTSILNYGFAVLIGGLFFFIQFYLTKGKGIGGGDIRLGLFMGAVTGWYEIIYALIIAYLLGGIISIAFILFKKANLSTKLPFAPFLTIATFIILLYNDYIQTLILKLQGLLFPLFT